MHFAISRLNVQVETNSCCILQKLSLFARIRKQFQQAHATSKSIAVSQLDLEDANTKYISNPVYRFS